MANQTLEETVDMFESQYHDEARRDLDGATIVYSVYETGSYEGSWVIVYRSREGRWFIDEGGHCSCNGPRWSPRETTIEYLIADCGKDVADAVLLATQAQP